MRRGEHTDLEAALRRLKIHLAVGEIDRETFVCLGERIGIADPVSIAAQLLKETAADDSREIEASWVAGPCAQPHDGDLLLGRWRLGQRLGGQGPVHVFRAYDQLRDEAVVVRAVVSGEAIPEPVLDRIVSDGGRLRSGSPPGCVRVLDVVVDALHTTVVVVLEAIEGQSLADLGGELRAASELPETTGVVEILQDLLRALDALNRIGLVHGRVQPSSVVVVGQEPGQPCTADRVELCLLGIDLGSVYGAADPAWDLVAASQLVAELATGWSSEEQGPVPPSCLEAALGGDVGRVVQALALPERVGWFTAADGLDAVREACTGPPQAELEVGWVMPELSVDPAPLPEQQEVQPVERHRADWQSAPAKLGGWWRVTATVLALGMLVALAALMLRGLGPEPDAGPETPSFSAPAHPPDQMANAPTKVRVQLRVDRPDGVLWLDGERLGQGTVGVDVVPGRHLFAVTGPEGCTGEERWVDLAADAGTLQVTLGLSCDQRPGPEHPARFAGEVWVAPRSGIRFRYLPPGSFQMGSPSDAPERQPDEVEHRVTLSRGTWLGETEVTQAQWQAVLGTAPSHHGRCGAECPVENVSWFEVVGFANALSRLEGLEPCYRIDGQLVRFTGLGCTGFRLPTEAEWEYGARSGATTAYARGDGLTPGEANFAASDGPERDPRTVPVASFPATRWGLQDVHGNVREWVWDLYGPYRWSSEVDPLGPATGAERVVRGGGCESTAADCRLARRTPLPPTGRRDDLGLRLARTADAR